MIICLSGGVGGAKLALGLSKLLSPEELTVIVNTGDDLELLGLRICPDVDTVIYTLAGIVNPVTGWGLSGDSFRCLDALQTLGWPGWFRLGDLDLATHLWRTELLRRGVPLSDVTRLLCEVRGVDHPVLPATDAYVPTYLDTDRGRLHLQEYLVRDRSEPQVRGYDYHGASEASPAPGVLSALDQAKAIIIGPSNPFISIGPILAIPALRLRLEQRRCRIAAVSPIVGGQALKGPAAKMLREAGLDSSAAAVARYYAGLVDLFVLDEQDRDLLPEIEREGMRALVTNTVMSSLEDKIRLAGRLLEQM